jgi:hypothetical protein
MWLLHYCWGANLLFHTLFGIDSLLGLWICYTLTSPFSNSETRRERSNQYLTLPNNFSLWSIISTIVYAFCDDAVPFLIVWDYIFVLSSICWPVGLIFCFCWPVGLIFFVLWLLLLLCIEFIVSTRFMTLVWHNTSFPPPPILLHVSSISVIVSFHFHC